MSEFAGWTVVLGLGLALGWMFFRSSRRNRHSPEIAKAILRSNEAMLARLAQPSAEAAPTPEPIMGVVLDSPRRPPADRPENRANASTTASGACSAG